MEQIRSLARVSIDVVTHAFAEAFSEYERTRTPEEYGQLLKRRGYVPELSFGAFDPVHVTVRKACLMVALLCFHGSLASAQIKYAGKAEAGYLKFQNHTIKVDPGPGWKGYNLQYGQNGVGLNLIHGVKFGERLFTGAGIGYVNFEGVNGLSLFADAEVTIMKKRLSPYLDVRAGYNHIWNQYEGCRGGFMFESGIGVKYRLTQQFSLYLQTGIVLMQQSLLFPLRIGIGF